MEIFLLISLVVAGFVAAIKLSEWGQNLKWRAWLKTRHQYRGEPAPDGLDFWGNKPRDIMPD